MGVDRINDGTDANAEAVGEKPDQRPPPPPDKPGTDGYPSRTDSRLGAAAANDTQTTDDVREEKRDTAQPSQEASERKDTTAAEDKSRVPGTSEVDEGESVSNDADVSERRFETDPGEAGTGSTPETDQRTAESDAGGRKERLDGQAAPHDSTATTETGRQPASPSMAERIEDKGTGEKSATEISESANATNPSGMGTDDDAHAPAPDAHRRPRDFTDAPGDVARDDRRKPARPTDDIAEAATKTAEVQGQPGSADKPQPAPADQDFPAADISPEGKGDAQGRETIANTDDASSNGAETPTQRIKPLDEAHLRAADEGPGEATSTADKKLGLGSEHAAEDEPSSEGAEATWITGGPDIAGDLPTGEELVKMESDKQSRAERARRKLYESGDEVLDYGGKVVNRVDQIFERPPTGHAETRTGPEVIPAPHEGVGAGDAATALIAAGVVLGEIFRRGREKLKQRKGV
jgi:hypothetical protein